MKLNTCVLPTGEFIWAIHEPQYQVFNLRETDAIFTLGLEEGGNEVINHQNFPPDNISVSNKGQIIEIKNPLPFFGATYIIKNQADRINLPILSPYTPHSTLPYPIDIDEDLLNLLLTGELTNNNIKFTLKHLGRRLLMALAQVSQNPKILTEILKLSCELVYDKNGYPIGLQYKQDTNNKTKPVIHDHELFEIVTNNPYLPDIYKLHTVLKPGVQGDNPIVGEYLKDTTHIWEYLRENSYIPWGHYASNMAHDSVRYSVEQLSLSDMIGLRHLYYQRVFVNMALNLGIKIQKQVFKPYSKEMEDIRLAIVEKIHQNEDIEFNATIWGWNYGFDYSPSGFRLNASHQQIHQQYALVKREILSNFNTQITSFTLGDYLRDFIRDYREQNGVSFFHAYIKAIYNNKRFDQRNDLPDSLIIHEDELSMVFVPKAQRCQGEIQIILKKPVGNILFCDSDTRESLDRALFTAIKSLHLLGAKMVTSYEISSRFDDLNSDQRLIYCLLPRHPQSPGAFSERLERWVTGHYPEDYANHIRNRIENLMK